MSALYGLAAALALFAAPMAVETPLADPAQEARANKLGREIRCVACENEPISQSGADIAADMRRLVRERIAQGDTDAQVRDYFRKRYGEFVLFRPQAEGFGLLVWLMPVFLLGLGGLVVAKVFQRHRAAGLTGQDPYA